MRKIFFGIILYLFITALEVDAATFQVPSDFPTIQQAINAAQDGDTILVAPGVYIENIVFTMKDVSVRSTGGPLNTTIQANGGTAISIGPRGALIGFTVTGGSASFGAGMEVIGTGSLIKGNIFTGNFQGSGGFGAAIGGNGASPIIEQNIFRGNSCDNQFLSGVVSLVNFSSPRIVNNIFEDNPCRAINMTLPVGGRPEVINNTMVRNRTGVRVDRRISAQLQVYRNNIIVNNDIGLEIDFGTEMENPTWENNLVFDNTTNYSGITDQTGQSGNVSASPLFVNLNGGDYHLQPGSPAIDAGNFNGAPTTDFDGNLRPLDGNGDFIAVVDIGAFEFGEIQATAFDLCLQDGSNGNLLKINSTTGEYLFTNCSRVIIGGIGVLIKKGGTISFQHNGGDRRLSAKIDKSVNKGSASIQILSQGVRFSIIDRNITNNTCSCPSL